MDYLLSIVFFGSIAARALAYNDFAGRPNNRFIKTGFRHFSDHVWQQNGNRSVKFKLSASSFLLSIFASMFALMLYVIGEKGVSIIVGIMALFSIYETFWEIRQADKSCD